MQNIPLYQDYDALSRRNKLPLEIPLYISKNLNQKFEIRRYQQEALARFFDYFSPENPDRKIPIHLLFNMATGSGKTFVMAGLILELYKQGYRNFLFFVNSTNIIEKTQDNFLNTQSSKYLFAEHIEFEGRRVEIRRVENFSWVENESINIKFSTIQGLHTDLHMIKENALSYDDFEKEKIVMLSDEAHHINATTKKWKLTKDTQEEKQSWEQTVMKILKSHSENMLLEFTATVDMGSDEVKMKYQDKLIYKYDLAEFRKDRYSKEVDILKADMPQYQRVLQALILSQYRYKLAGNNGIYLKPVILFKAQKTIEESENNLINFIVLIETLRVQDLKELKLAAQVGILQEAFAYFETIWTSLEELVAELKEDFAEAHCISANSNADLVSLKLNTLEDPKNKIRAVFAVAKLNEWWDVLNLFDIVRMYGDDGITANRSNVIDKDTKKVKSWPQTIAEAQLIGRGARYFPFSTPEALWMDKYKRKFDGTNNPLKILETFYYHTFFDSMYITEIRKALREVGLMDAWEHKEVELKLKPEFKSSEFYQTAQVYTNTRKPKSYNHIDSIEKLWISIRDYEHKWVFTWKTEEITVFEDDTTQKQREEKIETRGLLVSDIDIQVVRKALQRNTFYTFKSLSRYLWKLTSIDEFIQKSEYLGGIKIYFSATWDALERIISWNDRKTLLRAIEWLLEHIEKELQLKQEEFEGTYEFISQALSTLPLEKTIKSENDTFTVTSEWFAFEAITGTPEEKIFLREFENFIEELKEKYEDIYIVRNERVIALYSFDTGERFEPDFLLYMKEKKWKDAVQYQVFIEPKGEWFMLKDKWKNTFLKQIESEHQILQMNIGNYILLWLPFFNTNAPEEFKTALKERFIW